MDAAVVIGAPEVSRHELEIFDEQGPWGAESNRRGGINGLAVGMDGLGTLCGPRTLTPGGRRAARDLVIIRVGSVGAARGTSTCK